jgi:hypothetical protein
MKPTKSRGTKSSPASSAPKTRAKRDAKSANEVPVELISHASTPGSGGERGFSVKKSRSALNSARHSNRKPALELDRRGKPLPPRPRVGGIITPQ